MEEREGKSNKERRGGHREKEEGQWKEETRKRKAGGENGDKETVKGDGAAEGNRRKNERWGKGEGRRVKMGMEQELDNISGDGTEERKTGRTENREEKEGRRGVEGGET